MAGSLEGMSIARAPSSTRRIPSRSAFASRFEDLMQRGLDEAGVAESLGSAGLLLRATFDPDGRLVWGALRSEGPGLDLAGFGTGTPGDLQRLRWITAEHDFEIGFIHWWRSLGATPMARAAGRNTLLAAVRSLANASNAEAASDLIVHLIPSGRGQDRVLRLWQRLSWPAAEDGEAAGADLRSAALQAAERALTSGGAERRSALNEATEAYLRRIAGLWDLSSLSTALTSETDLVVQADDALHAVPVAWIPFENGPLYRRVRTVRASLRASARRPARRDRP